jgi:hypothetical protein
MGVKFNLLLQGYQLAVFEDKVLKGIFKPKTEEITGDQRKLIHKELQDL